MSTVTCVPDAVRAEWDLPAQLAEQVRSLADPVMLPARGLLVEDLRLANPSSIARAARLLQSELAGDTQFLNILTALLRDAGIQFHEV